MRRDDQPVKSLCLCHNQLRSTVQSWIKIMPMIEIESGPLVSASLQTVTRFLESIPPLPLKRFLANDSGAAFTRL
ncbi:hypothetical protein LIA77_04207 [Sarocladium implicatum]|nr:hypothetical protein LIA77_04207 [Sarocladium implicatum]